jgi:hypothetical protein
LTCGTLDPQGAASTNACNYYDDEPPTALLDLPDGSTVVATIRLQWQEHGRWRATVEWSEGPGLTYYQARWCDEMRPHV